LRPLLTPENRILLDRFTALRRQPLLRRARSFAALGLHRQSPVGQVSLWLALLLGRV
jgi:hypothetical protein